MTIRLAKTLDGMKMYDGVYDLCNEPIDRVEEYFIEENHLPYLLEHFVDQVNSECGTILDDGDYDFFNIEQCALLKTWINKELDAEVPEHIHTLYGVILGYIDRAILYNTGIAIDL